MSERDKQWIVKVGNRYLAHPRGEWTKKPSEAFGWHYKKDAETVRDEWRAYHNFTNHNPPGMVPVGMGRGKTVDVMRREDALEIDA